MFSRMSAVNTGSLFPHSIATRPALSEWYRWFGDDICSSVSHSLLPRVREHGVLLDNTRAAYCDLRKHSEERQQLQSMTLTARIKIDYFMAGRNGKLEKAICVSLCCLSEPWWSGERAHISSLGAGLVSLAAVERQTEAYLGW